MEPLPFLSRFFLAYVFFFRAIFDGDFAARALAVRDRMPELPAPKPEAPPPPEKKDRSYDEALLLLGLLQREGRLLDFVEQDVAAFSDADVGAAARLVHDGCRKALRQHVELAPVREEEEGAKVTVETAFDAQRVKLVGDVKGSGPYAGTLQHRGWRAKGITLPEPMSGHDATVLAPAEVEV